MKTILDYIIENKRIEVEQKKALITYKELESSPFFERKTISLKSALEETGFGIIAEVKRKSPSAGEIKSVLNPVEMARKYSEIGAVGISVLTDYTYFGGSIEDLKAIRVQSNLPLLRKEFIVDEFQLFEAKASGADAVLLIAEVLTEQEILHFTIIAKSLGMEVIAEFHEKQSYLKLNDEIDIIGVNNRNLKIQQTNLKTSFEAIEFIRKNACVISESGIRSMDELIELRQAGFKGALIGESLLKEQLTFNKVLLK